MWPSDRGNNWSTTDNTSKGGPSHELEEFRQSAEKQINRFLDGFDMLPSLFSNLMSRVDEPHSHVFPHIHVSEMMRRSNKSGPDPAQSADQPSQEAITAVRTLLQQARKANQHLKQGSITNLYLDDSRDGQHQWLSVDWFENNPYSPAQIEVHPILHQHGSHWRAAFEDLLAAQLGKPQQAHDAFTYQSKGQSHFAAWAQTPRDWMLGLQCRGLLPPQLPHLYKYHPRHQSGILDFLLGPSMPLDRTEAWRGPGISNDIRALAWAVSTFDDDEHEREGPVPTTSTRRAETEQDLYEAFLGDARPTQRSREDLDSDSRQISPRSSPQAASQLAQRATQQEIGAETKPADTRFTSPASSIVSTLTTTERTTLPDGTVTTKMVLKKRFADGREESSETSTTHNAHEERHLPSVVNSNAEDERSKSKTKSWFWS